MYSTQWYKLVSFKRIMGSSPVYVDDFHIGFDEIHFFSHLRQVWYWFIKQQSHSDDWVNIVGYNDVDVSDDDQLSCYVRARSNYDHVYAEIRLYMWQINQVIRTLLIKLTLPDIFVTLIDYRIQYNQCILWDIAIYISVMLNSENYIKGLSTIQSYIYQTSTYLLRYNSFVCL